MATSGEISASVADALGFPHAMVATVVRLLREAGELQTKGRGRGAAAMDARDVASILIGCLAAEYARDCACIVRAASAMACRKVTLVPGYLDPGSRRPKPKEIFRLRATFFQRTPLAGMDQGHSFGEALTRLIRLAQADSLFAVLTMDDYEEGEPRPDVPQDRFLRIAITSRFIGGSNEIVHAEIEQGVVDVYVERRYYGMRPPRVRRFDDDVESIDGRDPVTKTVTFRLGQVVDVARALV